MFIKAALVASLAGLIAAAPASREPIRVPLGKRYSPRSNGEVNTEAFFATLKSTLSKYNHPFAAELARNTNFKRAVGSEPLTDQVEGAIDELYYGTGTVGAESPQDFTINFDTGSADFFVPGPQCGSQQGCVGTTQYDQGGTAEQNSTTVTYGSGQVTGDNYLDTVCIAGLCASNVNVVSLTNAQGFSTSASNSLMGFGFSTIANSKQPTFFEKLIAEGTVDNDEFAFYLGRAASNTQGQSLLTLGGVDGSRYTGDLASNPVTNKGYWQIALDGVTVDGAAIDSTSGQAAIDTGTTVLIAPTAAAEAIFAQIPGSQSLGLNSGGSGTTLYGYPCDTTSIPSVTFGGVDYAINPLDFNLGTVTLEFADALGAAGLDGGVLRKLIQFLLGFLKLPGLGGGSSSDLCIAGIAAADIQTSIVPDGTPFYIVGDVFLKNWYSVYSYEGSASVSFAKGV